MRITLEDAFHLSKSKKEKRREFARKEVDENKKIIDSLPIEKKQVFEKKFTSVLDDFNEKTFFVIASNKIFFGDKDFLFDENYVVPLDYEEPDTDVLKRLPVKNLVEINNKGFTFALKYLDDIIPICDILVNYSNALKEDLKDMTGEELEEAENYRLQVLALQKECLRVESKYRFQKKMEPRFKHRDMINKIMGA